MESGRTVLTAPSDAPCVVMRPGVTVMRLVPNWVNSAMTKRCSPSPIEVSRITAAMPTAMPSAVSAVRRRCVPSETR